MANTTATDDYIEPIAEGVKKSWRITISPQTLNQRDELLVKLLAANWTILEPVIRAGETYALSCDMNREEALAYWFSNRHEVFVADDDGQIVGTYFLRPNQKGGGSHVANCGYITATAASGRGVARRMCAHSIGYAKSRGFRAMQFNFVVKTKGGATLAESRI